MVDSVGARLIRTWVTIIAHIRSDPSRISALWPVGGNGLRIGSGESASFPTGIKEALARFAARASLYTGSPLGKSPISSTHPFTDPELAWIVQGCDRYSIDHRGIRRMLGWHERSPEVLQNRHRGESPAGSWSTRA
jgi:hypothetical protein